MRVVTIEKLQSHSAPIVEMPAPRPQEGELLVEVLASGVNRLDLNRIASRVGPEILGVEIAGRVISNQSNDIRFTPGTLICGIIDQGGYADQAVIAANQAMLLLPTFDVIQAVAIPENYLTAYQALYWLGDLQPHATVLIHAGASGVGLAAIQLAKQLSQATVIATASARKHAACYAAGADLVIDYHTTDFATATFAYDQHGADVILDFIGAPYLQQNLTCAATAAHHILISTLGGSVVHELDLRLIADKRISLIGTLLSPRSDAYKASLVADFTAATTTLFTNEQLLPVIDHVFAFTDVVAALQYMANNQNIGKLILKH